MDRPKMADIKGVRYTGASNVRLLDAADLEALDLGSLETDGLRWDDENNHIVPVEDLNAHAVDVLLGLEEFEVV